LNVLLLGGAGFIGTHLARRLLDLGHVVRVFDRPTAAIPPAISGHARLQRTEGDLLNHNDLGSALDDMDVVFHLVSTTLPKSSNDNPEYDIETNLVMSVRLLDAARRRGIRKLVFISSGGTIYGVPESVPIPESHPCNPTSSYGIVKLAIEKYLTLFRLLHGLESYALRISNPYGEFQKIHVAQGAVGVFLDRALNHRPIEIWGDGSVTRDYVYIGDVADALVRMLDYHGDVRVFNIGSGVGIDLNDLLGEIERSVGHPVERTYQPSRRFDVPVNVLDIALARRELGWQPSTSLQDGLARTASWMRDER